MTVGWAYAVTTVKSRSVDGGLLGKTLSSLAEAGFDCPHVFIDGAGETLDPIRNGLACTSRGGANVGAFGNWLLSLAELLIRSPDCDRYAIFQDDFVTYPNLRAYLDACPMPEKGYWNLFTFLDNERVVANQPVGWHEAAYYDKATGLQTGRGALGLVFSRAGVLDLLTAKTIWNKTVDPAPRGKYSLDGAVVTALNIAGYKEYVHNPSLVQHKGRESSILKVFPNGSYRKTHKRDAHTFRGEGFDATRLIAENESLCPATTTTV